MNVRWTMVSKGNIASGPPDLNALAESLARQFRVWVGVDPLEPLPTFAFGDAGHDLGLPRFGVAPAKGRHAITVDTALENVSAAVVLREVVRTFIPPSCLVDITHDIINRFCEQYLGTFPPKGPCPLDAPRWQALIKAHTRRYVVHFLGSPLVTDLDFLPHGSPHFRVLLEKLRKHAPRIPPGQSTDIVAVISRSIVNSLWEHGYSPEDAEFIALMADYMGRHAAFPALKRLAAERPGWTPKRCEAAARRLGEDLVSPTYFPNPGALGLVFCWILIETPPMVSSYLARHLIFLPFATQSLSQCVGAPFPTYFCLYLLAPAQLDDFVEHLVDMKQKGVLLDFQVFRVERFVDVMNWNATLAVPSPAPLTSEITNDLGSRPPGVSGLAASWLVQQLVPRFGVRKFVPWAVTHLDPARNYQAFLAVIQDAALLSTADLQKDLAEVMPLLERYRNVEYVIRVLDLGMALLRHLFDHPGVIDQESKEFGKLGWTWKYFPARDWLMGQFRGVAGAETRQANLLMTLSLAARILQFFAHCTIPPDIPAGKYLCEQQRALVSVIKKDLAQVPAGEGQRLQYFTDLHARVVSERIVIPKIDLSPMFRPATEDFYLFARTSRSWEELTAGLASRFASHVHHCLLLQFRDQTGAPVIGGIIRTTQDQFQAFRRSLVGPGGFLGPGATLLVGRRVPFWDIIRRNYVETYDVVTQAHAPIKEYLSLVRAEHLAGWTRPRGLPPPYARKILAEPYLGPVERATRPPSSVVHLTPKLVAGLKASFLSGTSALHNLVERRLRAKSRCDLNWPAYGLERYFLHVFLSTRNPQYIFSHLVTPATRRVLVSSAVSGFQTVLLEYLWPKGAPDDKFLQYLYTRTEKNVLGYSVHRVLSDTRFFNLDKVQGTGDSEHDWDDTDLLALMLARPQVTPRPQEASEFVYGGDTRHAPGSAGWEMAAEYFATGIKSLPPDNQPAFEFDPRMLDFSEKTALIFRGDFDALPLCQALPFGHYFRTEEIAYESPELLAGQPGHVILFDFPATRVAQVDLFLDDLLRNPAVASHVVTSYLAPHSLRKIQNLDLTAVNPLRANPYDPKAGTYYHLPKRVLVEGKWHTLSLKDQMAQLHTAWSKV